LLFALSGIGIGNFNRILDNLILSRLLFALSGIFIIEMGLLSALIGKSNEDKATIWINLEDNSKQVWFGGETITGTVCLEVIDAGMTALALILIFEGGEETVTHWTTSSGGKHKTTHHHYRKQQRNVVSIPYTLENFEKNQSIPIGRRTYNFSFELPNILPPTIPRVHGNGNNRGHCELSYKIGVTLATPGYIATRTKSIEKIIIIGGASMNPVPTTSTQSFIEPVEVPINICGCIGRGTIVIGAIAEKTVLNLGDTTQVNVALMNNSTKNISHGVEIRIYQEAKWNYLQHHNRSDLVLANHNAMPNEENMIMSPVTKEEKARGQGRVVPSSMLDMYSRLANGHGDIMCSLTMPGNAAYSYSGALFSIGHRYEVSAMTGCCVTNPTITSPVHVVMGPLSQPEAGTNSHGIEQAQAQYFANAYATREIQQDVQQFPQNWDATATSVSIPTNNFSVMPSYGGHIIDIDGDIDGDGKVVSELYSGLEEMSISSLTREMETSLYDKDIVQKYALQASNNGKTAWMCSLTSEQIKNLVSIVQDEFTRAEIATMFLNILTRPIVCLDVSFIMKVLTVAMQKTDFIKETLPRCTDFGNPQMKDYIRKDLSSFELMLVGQVLEK
jgi:hypothetical protein